MEENPPLEDNVGNRDPIQLPDANDEEIQTDLLDVVSTGSAIRAIMIPTLVLDNDVLGSHRQHPAVDSLPLSPLLM